MATILALGSVRDAVAGGNAESDRPGCRMSSDLYVRT